MEVTNARVFTCLPLQNGVDFFSGSTPLDDLCVDIHFHLMSVLYFYAVLGECAKGENTEIFFSILRKGIHS
jgi:hypothetical protein